MHGGTRLQVLLEANGISFAGEFHDDEKRPRSASERMAGRAVVNQQRYGGQRIFVIQRDDYVYLLPYVEDDKLIALKTIIPSRKATKQYLDREPDDHET